MVKYYLKIGVYVAFTLETNKLQIYIYSPSMLNDVYSSSFNENINNIRFTPTGRYLCIELEKEMIILDLITNLTVKYVYKFESSSIFLFNFSCVELDIRHKYNIIRKQSIISPRSI